MGKLLSAIFCMLCLPVPSSMSESCHNTHVPSTTCVSYWKVCEILLAGMFNATTTSMSPPITLPCLMDCWVGVLRLHIGGLSCMWDSAHAITVSNQRRAKSWNTCKVIASLANLSPKETNVCPWEPIFYIIPKAMNCCTVKKKRLHFTKMNYQTANLFPHDLPTPPPPEMCFQLIDWYWNLLMAPLIYQLIVYLIIYYSCIYLLLFYLFIIIFSFPLFNDTLNYLFNDVFFYI